LSHARLLILEMLLGGFVEIVNFFVAFRNRIIV